MNAMRSILVLLLILVSNSVSAATASEESIRQLLEVTKARSLLDNMRNQGVNKIRENHRQLLQENGLSQGQQAIVLDALDKMVSLFESTFSWEKWELRYVFMYQEAFSEEEIKSMLSFYRTPAGQAVIDKMPVLTQQVINQTTDVAGQLRKELEKIQVKAKVELEATQ